MLLCLLLPRSRYDWLRDEGVDPDKLETSGNSQAALGAIVVVALALEVLALVTAWRRRERLVSAGMLAAVALGWAFRALA